MARQPAPVPADILDSLYGALVDCSLWPALVSRMTEWCGGLTGALQIRRLQPEVTTTMMISSGLDSGFHAAYVDHFYKVDPHLLRAAVLKQGATMLSREVLPDEDFVRTEFYNDFCRPQGMHDLQGAMIIRDAELAVSFAMYGPDARPFDENNRRRLDALIPHLSRVLPLAIELDRRSDAATALEGAQYATGIGVVRVDPWLRVLGMWGAAGDWFAKPDFPLVMTRGTLSARVPEDTEALRGAVTAAIAGRSIRVELEGARDVSLLVMPGSSRSELLPDPGANVVLVPAGASHPAGQRLLTNLPISLQGVALLMAQGLGDKEIASELQLELSTARTYASRVMKRLNVHGRRELMRLLRGA